MERLLSLTLRYVSGVALAALFVALPAGLATSQDAGEKWGAAMLAARQAYGVAEVELAVQNYAAALEIAEANFGEDDPRLYSTMINAATALRAARRSEEAAAMMERGIELKNQFHYQKGEGLFDIQFTPGTCLTT